MATDGALLSTLIGRLDADPKARPFEAYVLAAFEGEQALAQLLENATPPARPRSESAAPPEPRGAYLKSITVEGFRGVGARKTLDLPPGPGLTLVVGRNGSGKSSFAEALELLLTGDIHRWQEAKSKVWREGWRNLHHAAARVDAEFHVEGEKGATTVTTVWKEGADLEERDTFAQVHGKPRMSAAGLGWEQPLKTYRPFLSYSELGSMLAEGPSRLYDALAAILGLEDLTRAQTVLADARKPREKAQKDVTTERDRLADRLRGLDDDRARAALAALETDDLDPLEGRLTTAGSGSAGETAALRQLANLPSPGAAAAQAAADLRAADAQLAKTAGTLAARSSDLADVLDRALHFHETYGDGSCPVCGRPNALDAAWHASRSDEMKDLRDKARDASAARSAADAARKRAHALPVPEPDILARAKELGLDAGPAETARNTWSEALGNVDCAALASAIEVSAGPLETALAALRAAAGAELQRREDRWNPIAFELIAWLPRARAAAKAAAAVKPLDKAGNWLKEAVSDIRNARLTPIKEHAQEIWSLLRIQSNVSLADIRLTGASTRRTAELDLTVDGVECELGVMSQGEQNALALCLFIPRACLPDSPFRFAVIDDPVQSMDPSRVDGLARVLRETAQTRQVVVFTHDDRLSEAVRRQGIAATVIEVARRGQSAIELRRGLDPVERYLEDARAVALTHGLPEPALRRVVPGLCRMAIEAACAEAVRRRRLARGDGHGSVEDALRGLHKTRDWAAMAMFDTKERTDDVMSALNKAGSDVADVFREVNKGTHEGMTMEPMLVIRSIEKLSGWLRTRP